MNVAQPSCRQMGWQLGFLLAEHVAPAQNVAAPKRKNWLTEGAPGVDTGYSPKRGHERGTRPSLANTSAVNVSVSEVKHRPWDRSSTG